jgi:tetratricopeptide (TPR) repeat protein
LSRLRPALTALCLLLAAAPARAQNRDAFVEATLQFVQAADGSFGDEGRYMRSAVDAMAQALAQWDAMLARARTEANPVALAALEIERGRFARALDVLNRAGTLSPPDDPAPSLLRGLALDRLGRPDAAREAYRDAWRRAPDALAAAYRVASAPAPTASLQADRTAALDTLAAVVRQPSSAARFVVPTDRLLEEASAEAPLVPLARYAPAFALLEQGRYDEAVAALRVAVEGDPLTRASPDVIAAAAALRLGNWFGALDRLAAATAAAAPGAHRVRASAYLASGEAAQALAELSAAIEGDPSDERARMTAAELLTRSGRSADAVLALREAARQNPGSLRARWQLAQRAVATEDWPAAIDALGPVAESRPLAGAARVYAVLARAYAGRGEGQRAVRALRDRVGVIPHSSAAHAELGAGYRRVGQPLAARVEFLAALVLDPTNETARSALDALQ